MNDSFLLAVGTACWLGILTSISPCPLATNIAAVTFIGRKVDRPRYVVATGLLYTLGRTLTYVILGVLIVAGLLAMPGLSFFLQNHMNKILGPVLLLAGLFLLAPSWIKVGGPGFGQGLQARIEKSGLWGALVLGFLFALSFCPVSAALFFGSLIPLAVNHNSSILMPSIYGVGTALPVIGFSFLLAMGTRFVGVAFNKLSIIERWARRITAIVFVIVGIYLIFTYLV
jgi:cytochrome c-type biogenesis protein